MARVYLRDFAQRTHQAYFLRTSENIKIRNQPSKNNIKSIEERHWKGNVFYRVPGINNSSITVTAPHLILFATSTTVVD